MAGKYNLPRENLEFIVNDIGTELLPLFSVEDRLRGLPPEDVLKHISLKDLLEYISHEETQRQLSDEEREMFRQLGQRKEK